MYSFGSGEALEEPVASFLTRFTRPAAACTVLVSALRFAAVSPSRFLAFAVAAGELAGGSAGGGTS